MIALWLLGWMCYFGYRVVTGYHADDTFVVYYYLAGIIIVMLLMCCGGHGARKF